MITPEYKALLQRQHRETTWGGNTDFRHIIDLLAFVALTRSVTLLDFGSGRESLHNHLARITPELTVFNYDPGTDANELRPADMVVCCDVLEHIEPQYVDEILVTIFKLAQKAVFLVIALRQAKAKMVDGTPQHLLVAPSFWWLDRLRYISELEGNWHIEHQSVVENKELKLRLIRK